MLIADRCKETTTGTSTGNLTLLGASSGFQSLFTVFGTGSFFYCISHQSANEFEIGIGHMNDSTTFVRDAVYESSNSDALVSFSAGTKDVFNILPARQIRTRGQHQALLNNLALN